MSVICTTEVDGRLISWEGNAGTVEHSTLFGPLRDGRSFTRFYDDACDVGIVVRGNRQQIPFVLAHEEVDAEGDTRWWDLVSVWRSSGQPDGRFTIRVFND